MLVWDGLNTHTSRAMRELIAAYVEEHPRLELLYGARYSPDDNPVEMWLPQCELRRSSVAWLPGSLSFAVWIGVPVPVQRRRL